jgi:hypothetical protein
MPHAPSERPKPADLLRASQRFRDWKPDDEVIVGQSESGESGFDEKHYTPSELAALWGLSPQTIRDLFKDEEGVLKPGSNGTRNRRGYKTLQIPHSVAERVHTRLSA